MATAAEYVSMDSHGVMRVGSTHVMLDSVLASFQAGASAETIAQEYPSLSLEEVYGAITYYLRHQREVDVYLTRQDVVWREARGAASRSPSPVVARLREEAARRGIGRS